MKVRSVVILAQVLPTVMLLQAQTPSAAQRPMVELAALTVPEGRLPPACRLQPPVAPQAPSDTGRGARVPTLMSLFPTNPWSGRQREIVATIARRVDGVDDAPPQPDGPPLDAGQAAQFRLRWADGIAEAYRAAYAWRGGSDVEVVAVRFDDEKRARPGSAWTESSSRRTTSRVVIRAVVARVSTPGGINNCFEAIRNHIESLR